jgi:hypothetical protein
MLIVREAEWALGRKISPHPPAGPSSLYESLYRLSYSFPQEVYRIRL